MSKLFNNHKLVLLIAILLFIYQNYLIIFANLVGDDIYNTTNYGNRIILNKSLPKYIFDIILGWSEIGRFNFITTINTQIFFNFLKFPMQVKIGHLIIHVLMCLSFIYFIYKMFDNNFHLALLSSLLVSIFFQYRSWHDPFIMFPTIYQFLLIYIFFSLIFFKKYLEEKNIFFLIFSLILFFFVCSVSEIGLILFPLFIFFEYTKSSKIKTSYFFLIISIIFILVSFFIKINNDFSGYEGAVVSFDIKKNLYAFILQFTSALPGSYSMLNNKNFIFSDFVYFVCFTFFLYNLIKRLKQVIIRNKLKKLFYFGLILIFFPSFLSFSVKYSDQLILKGFGYGYLPVLIQYIGVCMIAIYILQILLKLKNKIFLKFFITFLVFISTINIASNRAVILKTGPINKVFRENLAIAIEKGILKNVNNFSNIFFANKHMFWTRPHFIANHSNKIIFSQNTNQVDFYGLTLKDQYLGDNRLHKKVTKKDVMFKTQKSIGNSFILRGVKLKKKGNYYIFPRDNQKILIAKKIKKERNYRFDVNYDDTSKVYLIYDLPNFHDNRVILAEIEKISLDASNKVNKAFTKKISVFSEKDGEVHNFNLDNYVDIKKIINEFDLINPKVNIVNFFRENKNKLKDKEKSASIYKVKKNNKSSNFYKGSINCSLDILDVHKYSHLFSSLYSTKYQKMIIKIKNQNDEKWKINDFINKDKILTIRPYLINKNNKKKILGNLIFEDKIIIKPYEQLEVTIGFDKIIKLRKNILRHKKLFENYKFLVITLVHEGKMLFDANKEFSSCKIKI